MLTIGKLAAAAGVRSDTLRYYEREGLIEPAGKSPAGYRLYDQDSARRLRFIKQAQHCGVTQHSNDNAAPTAPVPMSLVFWSIVSRSAQLSRVAQRQQGWRIPRRAVFHRRSRR